MEEAIPAAASRLGGSRTTTVKDVIEYVCPDLQTSCLKLASSNQKTLDQLLKVDQQGVGSIPATAKYIQLIISRTLKLSWTQKTHKTHKWL